MVDSDLGFVMESSVHGEMKDKTDVAVAQMQTPDPGGWSALNFPLFPLAHCKSGQMSALPPLQTQMADYWASKFLGVAWEGNGSRPQRCLARGCSWSRGTLLQMLVGPWTVGCGLTALPEHVCVRSELHSHG